MLINLKNGDTSMVISTLGAEPQSLVYEGREYIWQGDKTYWFRRAPLLFPMIGPTKDSKIIAEGKLYDMPNNGFARDLEFEVVETKDNLAVFRLEDSEKTRSEYYPYGFELLVTYTLLPNGYEASATITAKDDLWYTFGWHPAFSLDINGEGTELDTYTVNFELEEKLDKKTPVNGKFVYEKNFIKGDSFDISRELTDIGPIIMDNVKSSEVTLTSSAGEHGVTATMGDMTTFTVWTCMPQHGQFVCIEPMVSFGDADRTQEIEKMEETKLLKKGEKTTYTNTFTVF